MSDNYEGKVNGDVALNLADWIERRRDAVGPYADHIIKSVRAHETEIAQLRAELTAYESALEEIATYDTGATAGLAYTAQLALDTRRKK